MPKARQQKSKITRRDFIRRGTGSLPNEQIGISLRVSNSPKHGRGIYVTQAIPKGVKVIEYVGKLVPVKESEALAEKQMQRAGKSGTGHVYLFTLNNKYDIDGNVPYNKARLINHSCDPNCEVQIIKGHIWILSLRAIKAGEELTYDYGFNMDYWQDHVCRCGTKKCLGYIVSASRRGALARVLKDATISRRVPLGQTPGAKRI